MAKEKSKGKKKSKDWIFRDLDNYKAMHAKLAREKGVDYEFQHARTLTQARKILFGTKVKKSGRE